MALMKTTQHLRLIGVQGQLQLTITLPETHLKGQCQWMRRGYDI